jgi:hypothetical protein
LAVSVLFHAFNVSVLLPLCCQVVGKSPSPPSAASSSILLDALPPPLNLLNYPSISSLLCLMFEYVLAFVVVVVLARDY